MTSRPQTPETAAYAGIEPYSPPIPSARIWFDFDGTLVELPSNKIGLTNLRKYPLNARPGALEFMQGVKSAGAEIGGVVSRRPELRRSTTLRSIKELGLHALSDPERGAQIDLTGKLVAPWRSEREKARRILDYAASDMLDVFIEHKPHKLGVELIDLLRELSPTYGGLQIALGVAPSENQEAYMSRLGASIEERGLSKVKVEDTFSINVGGSVLYFVPIQVYTSDFGYSFARQASTLMVS